MLLIVITLLGISSMRTTSTELTMAGNQQLRMEAIERAQSIVDGVYSDSENFVVDGSSGYTNCTSNVPMNTDGSDPCHERAISLPTSSIFLSTATTGIVARVKREDPPVIPPPRGLGSSVVAFDAAPFSVEADYDETSLGAGRAGLVQGFIVLVPKHGQ